MTDTYVDSVHPPNVVLVDSNQTSPDHNPQSHCSPLSTAPNSPYRVSYDEGDHEDDDDDDDDEEIRPEEIQELLDTPASNRKIQGVTLNEVPFDERVGHNKVSPEPRTETGTYDTLLGRPPSKQPPSVSPIPMHEDIDAYHEEEEEESDNRSDEKKEEPPIRPLFSSFSSAIKQDYSLYPNRVVPPTLSDDDCFPMDERQETVNVSDDALPLASPDAREMEQRVQNLIRRRNSGSSPAQVNYRPQPIETGVSSPSFDDIEGEPPSLTPQRDVHSSMESGSSSYYYDGSAINSSVTDDVNNTTLESTASLALGGNARVSMSIHPPLEVTEDKNSNFYSRLEVSRDESTPSSDRLRSSSSRMDSSTTPSSSFEVFTSQFDYQTTSNSFADIVSGTASRALNQVSDDLASFLVMSQEPPKRSPQKRSKKHGKQEYPPVSPSQESDGTNPIDNLSPRRERGVRKSDSQDELIYQQRPSEKLARARSLVSGRQSKSPTTAPYLQSSNSWNDPKKRARQVMSKRERERPSSKSSADNSSDALNIPVPPTLYRIAAMMEGLGGNEEADMLGGESDAVWPSSVGQFMEEYQTAIKESLRNLSIDEISGLAQENKQQKSLEPEFGKDMVSPGIPLSPSTDAADPLISNLRSLKDEDYDNLVSDMTFGSCLQMPQLDHPSPVSSRNNSTAQRPGDANGVQRAATSNNFDMGPDHQYHSNRYEQQHQHVHDEENYADHQERAVFAKALSERLMDLAPNSSQDGSASADEKSDSPDKPEKTNTFDSKDSSFAMSPPTKNGAGDKNHCSMAETKYSRGGLYASNMPKNGVLPHSDQPSVSSDTAPETPSRDTANSKARDRSGTPGTPKTKDSFADNKPAMVKIIDNETGIPKGDVMLSLLCDNSFQASKEKPDSWAWRVREAMWRGREMRREKTLPGVSRISKDDDDQPASTRSLPVDVDDVRVVGGIKNVASIEEKAISHLEQDQFEQALELYEDIIFNYYSFFEQVLAKRGELSSEDITSELSNFKPYIGASLHNLGVIHLLKGDYEDAFSFFKRAVDNRRACLGDDHYDTVTSLVRLATCRFAMDNFADAHANLELALALAGSKARTTNDYCQLGEILNNLGCLSYMCGQATKAMKLFRESLDVQLAVLNSTLYGGSTHAAHTATLNISITRGNIGFLALVLRDASSGILALEASLREQRLLLSGAHVTLVSTMDHLAVANLLDGRTHKAVKMLKRIYELQKATYGPNDKRCIATLKKILTIRGQNADPHQGPPPGTRPHRPSSEGARSSRPGSEQPYDKSKDRNDEGISSSRCTPVPSGHSAGGSGGGGKVNSMFKAIRSSLGRRKSS